MIEGSCFLGVDGGGTKTEFVCIDAAGVVIARAVTGTTYHLQIGLEEAVRRLDQGIAAICTALGATPAVFGFVFFGLPAYGEDGTADPLLHAACGRLLGHGRYLCGNDMVCGWAGSLACADGINIVAGTGSIGYGECQGRSARVGGWGEVFGDEGSAYWIAVQGLALFSRMSDGRAPRGPLHSILVEALALKTDLDLCERVTGPNGMARGDIAALAELVSRAAAQGDTGALAILHAAARELADHAIALRRTLAFAEEAVVPVSWSGGVLTNQSVVREAFVAILRDRGGFSPAEPAHPPGYGAALYARQMGTRTTLAA
jgi:N-acetylglucosamine kinase-like BadF-type ATPase